MRQKLREADFVVYSSKRIYDSVDELPERYPMTNLYYQAMWDGRLGFELATEVTAPPALFGWNFDDRHADESWSLYDHPQVTVFRKVRANCRTQTMMRSLPAHGTRPCRGIAGSDSPFSPLLNCPGARQQQRIRIGWPDQPVVVLATEAEDRP